MSRNYYSEINLHLVWHCKESSPLLTPVVEPLAHGFIRKRIVDTPGAFVFEIGGTETHVHIAVTVPPTLTPSEFVGQLKGGSSHDVNQELGRRDRVLQWQARLRHRQLRNARFGLGPVVHSEPARAPRQRHNS